MKPHPRIRKALKWGGAAVTVLLGACVVCMCFGSWTMTSGSLSDGSWRENEQPVTISFEEVLVQHGRVEWSHCRCRRPGVPRRPHPYLEKPWTAAESFARDLVMTEWTNLFVSYVSFLS